LTEAERAIFCELAVFTGGFSMEAAESVCLAPDTFDLVFSLRDKSLLKTTEAYGETRYYMLETIREYSMQKLLQSDSLAALRNRHASYFLRLASEWSEKLATSGSDSSAALRVLRSDLDNIRSGMDWSASGNMPQMTMEYGKALFPYLRRHGMVDECDIRLIIAEDAARQIEDEKSVARLLNQRGLLSMERADLTRAKPLLEESRAISERLGDDVRVLVTSINLGNVYGMLGEFRLAREQWEGALALDERTPQPRYGAFLRENLGILACQEGRDEEARAHYAVSLDMHAQAGNREGIASTLYNSSEVWRRCGEYAEALRRLNDSKALYRELNHQRGLALAGVRIGLVLIESGKPNDARPHLDEGVRIALATANRHAEMYGRMALARLAIVQGDVEAAKDGFSKSYQLSVDLSDRRHRADTILHASTLAGPEAGQKLLRWLAQEYDSMGVEIPMLLHELLRASDSAGTTDSQQTGSAETEPELPEFLAGKQK
jgi:tetratricopeptide (TPR) repeat protein